MVRLKNRHSSTEECRFYLLPIHYSLKRLVDFWKVISNSEKGRSEVALLSQSLFFCPKYLTSFEDVVLLCKTLNYVWKYDNSSFIIYKKDTNSYNYYLKFEEKSGKLFFNMK